MSAAGVERFHTCTPSHEGQKGVSNYRGVSLLSIPGKELALVLLEKLQAVIDPQLSET